MLKFLSLYFFQCGLSLLQDVWASAGRLKGWGQKWSGGSLIHTSGVHTSAGWCQLLAKMSARAVGWTPTCGLFMWCELLHNGESGFWGPVPQVELNRRCVCVCVCVCVCTRACIRTSHLTVYDPMGCSLPGSPLSVEFSGKDAGVGCHFLLQGSSWPRNRTQVYCFAGGFYFLTAEPPGKPDGRYIYFIIQPQKSV